jgi:DNA-binding LacI/PurR family transcriptional regulator
VAAATAAGATVRRLTAPPGEPIAAGHALPAMLRAMSDPPTACGLANDHLGCGALLGAQAAGIAVPEELALIGFGDFELAAHLAPGLTTLAPPRREIGQRTAALLLAASTEGADAPRVKLDCPLVVRGSTDRSARRTSPAAPPRAPSLAPAGGRTTMPAPLAE